MVVIDCYPYVLSSNIDSEVLSLFEIKKSLNNGEYYPYNDTFIFRTLEGKIKACKQNDINNIIEI